MWYCSVFAHIMWYCSVVVYLPDLKHMCTSAHVYWCTYVTGPAKRDQVGTKYTMSQNGAYLEFCVQYLLSVSCKMLPMKLLIDGENFIYIALADH